MKNIEVEVKYVLDDHLPVKEFLEKNTSKGKQNVQQIDIYFTPAHENFLDQKPTVDRWLRVRKTEHGSSINYKHWHDNGSLGTISCDEIETSVGDITQIEAIFQRLDMKNLVTVDKTRSTFLFQDTEIVLDYIDELGRFIEIENKGIATSLEDATNNVFDVAKKIGVDKNPQDKKGYPYLLLEKRGLL